MPGNGGSVHGGGDVAPGGRVRPGGALVLGEALGEGEGDGDGLGVGHGSSVARFQVYRPYECAPFLASAIQRSVYGLHDAGPTSRIRIATLVDPSGPGQPCTYQSSARRGSVPRRKISVEANGVSREGSSPDP